MMIAPIEPVDYLWVARTPKGRVTHQDLEMLKAILYKDGYEGRTIYE